MDFEIVTDSSCNLKEEMIDEFGLHVLPLTFMVDGEQRQSYLKGQVTDLQQFYTMMREGKVITTSLPNLADSEALLRGLLEAGRDVLYLGFSSGLSGTYEAISLLCNQLAAEFPERKIFSVDTLAASVAKACSYGMRFRRRVRASRSRSFATGWSSISSTWRTGSPSTTSCSCGEAAASRRQAPGRARF